MLTINAPKKREPVSPINTLAGWRLKIKKPKHPPTKTDEIAIKHVFLTTVKEIIDKKMPTHNDCDAASPYSANNKKGKNIK